jgi:PAS domain S-box-containing protein
VFPLVVDDGNRRLLTEWLGQHPSYEAVDPADSIEEPGFDVCIIDEAAFSRHLDVLRERKAAAAPVLLPYLLLLPESGTEIADTDAGDLADNVVTDTIDEIVSLPIQQAELHWRLSALLRLREQSLTLRARERELERQVDLFERAQDIADVGAWEYDVDADEALWTDEVYRIHGLPTDTVPSPDASLQHYHPNDRPVIEAAFEAAIEDGEPYDVEVRLIDTDDTETWVRTRGEPQYTDGELTHVRGTIQDITQRKERERDLQRIKQAVESAGHAIYITDPDGVIEYVNPAFEEMTGFSEAGIVGETPRVLDSGEMQESDFERLREAVLSGDVYKEEVINRRKNGETYVAMQTIAPVTDGDEVHAFVAIQDDITDRKKRKRTLTRREQAINEAPVGIVITDPTRPDNPMVYVNDAFVAMTGYPREESVGRNCRFLQGDTTDPETIARIREAVEAAEPVSVDIRNYRQDGTEFWNHLEVAPVTNDAGEVVNYVGFQQDVTDRKQRQEQIAVLDRLLRHNLRNDINVIRGHAETISAEASNAVAASAETILDTSDQLLGLAEKERQITELLLKKPTQSELDLDTRLRDVASTVESEHPDASVRVSCPDGLTIRATTQFGRALQELVTNAVVHDDSPSPDVAVTVSRTDEAVRIDVADTGPPIPEMERNVLTDELEQTPLYHGSGLGLWLVNVIVTRSGGVLSIAENSPTGNVVGIELQQ